MKSLPIRFGLQANYFVHKYTPTALSGYYYAAWVAVDGSVVIQRIAEDTSEILYANGMTDLTQAWTDKETLNYKTIPELLA